MALPDVKIILRNGSLNAIAAFAEGVAGLVCTGVAVTDKIQLGDPRLVTTLKQAEDIGITLADNPTAYRAVKEFYAEGDGKELYIMLVADTMEQTEMLDKTNANGAVKLLNYALGRIRLLFTSFLPPSGYTLTTTNGLDADVFTAITNAQALAEEYAAKIQPLRVVIEGRAFTGVAANLTDLTTLTRNRVGVVVGSASSGAAASPGLFVGRLARIPVQRKASRVKDGALPISAAYVGTALVDNFAGLSVMHDKGYIVMRKYAVLGGYYFNSDKSAAGASDDYSMFARGRVIDKATVIAYGVYVNEIDDDIAVNEDGTIDAGVKAFLEQKIEEQINLSMTANKEIVAIKAFVDPAQKPLQTNKTKVTLKITPKGYNTDFEVELGF